MDLVIFVILIFGLSGLSIWGSFSLSKIKSKLIFIPSLVLGSITIASIVLTFLLDDEISIIAAVATFVMGPSAFINLIYASNQYFVIKKR